MWGLRKTTVENERSTIALLIDVKEESTNILEFAGIRGLYGIDNSGRFSVIDPSHTPILYDLITNEPVADQPKNVFSYFIEEYGNLDQKFEPAIEVKELVENLIPGDVSKAILSGKVQTNLTIGDNSFLLQKRLQDYILYDPRPEISHIIENEKVYEDSIQGYDEQFQELIEKMTDKESRRELNDEDKKNLFKTITSNTDLLLGNELARIVIFSESEFLVITPEGRFDGTQEVIKNLYYSKGMEILPLELYYEKYYTPGLLQTILNQEEIIEITSISTLKLPPKVTFTSHSLETTVKEAQLSAQVELSEGELREVLLYHNGKLIQTLDQPDDINNLRFNVTLSPAFDGENYFGLKAINTEGTESKPATMTIKYGGTFSVKPTLYMLTVGINNYINPKYNLNYANSDANSFEESIKNGAYSIFENVESYSIRNEEATKENIINRLNETKSKMKEQDMFIFYYAGHGVMSQSENGKESYFLVMHDIPRLYDNHSQLESKGISQAELKELSTDMVARKQVFVLDACQSGGALELMAARGVSEEKAIAQLARTTGTFWLAASGSEQYATEFEKLNHGVFTYAIIEGLSGKADGGNKDGSITIKELSAYIENRVPELSQEYKGKPQFPNGYGFGQDFPIVISK